MEGQPLRTYFFELRDTTKYQGTPGLQIFVGENPRQKSHKTFSGKFGEIRAKILCNPQNLPAPTPVLCTQLGLHSFRR